MRRMAQVTVDPDALRHNLARAREAAGPGRRVMAVVKADAYGHGLAEAAQALAEADALAVACIGEAACLRELGWRGRVVVLEGVGDAAGLREAAALGVDLVVHAPEQLALLEASPPRRPLDLWLKLDTGMHRLGFDPDEAAALQARVAALPGAGTVRWMTHLACADERASPATARQLERFARALAGLPGERSAANSGGLLAWPQARLDWVRPGIMLYGVSPFAGGEGAREGLRPAMRFETRLIAVTRRRRGDALGYGGAWVCPEDMPVGVAAAGYADGYPRHAPAGTPVLVRGREAALVGRVSMDMILVDLRAVPEARPGDVVALWGPELPVERVAARAGTIAYELLCAAGARAGRRLLAQPRALAGGGGA